MKMDYVFQTEDAVSFIMPFMRGGELSTYLNMQPTNRFTEEQARFFVIQVVLALGHLHKKDVCYRDLKAKNILMGEDGYICLTDFGMAKVLEGDKMTKTKVGTRDYVAPEVLTGWGYSFAVDWWSLGILTRSPNPFIYFMMIFSYN